MTDLNLSPKFKCSTLLCCRVREIFCIYRPTRARYFDENHQRVQGWIPPPGKKKRLNDLQGGGGGART